MKKILLGVLLLTGLAVSAQRAPRGQFHRPDRDQQLHRQEREQLTAEQLSTLQSKQMALALDLTTQQQNQVKELLFKHLEERAAIRNEHQNDSTQSRDGKFRYERMNQHLDQKLAFNRELKKIIGETQFEKWKDIHPMQGYPQREYGRRQHPHRN
jgi:hypothetical protein